MLLTENNGNKLISNQRRISKVWANHAGNVGIARRIVWSPRTHYCTRRNKSFRLALKQEC